MKLVHKILTVVVVFSFVLTACGGTAPEAANAPVDAMQDTMPEQPTEAVMDPHDAMPDATEAPTEAMSDDTAMVEGPAWYSASLTNVQTGESFTINDLRGKVILVETMAVWCSKCFSQQTQVKALHGLLGERDDFVSLGMDIDLNEDAEMLRTFTQANGFDWIYVVSTADVAREFASLYGGQFLNPPSTPMLIIDRHGAAHPLPFGIKSADDLLQALQPFLDEGM